MAVSPNLFVQLHQRELRGKFQKSAIQKSLFMGQRELHMIREHLTFGAMPHESNGNARQTRIESQLGGFTQFNVTVAVPIQSYAFSGRKVAVACKPALLFKDYYSAAPAQALLEQSSMSFENIELLGDHAWLAHIRCQGIDILSLYEGQLLKRAVTLPSDHELTNLIAFDDRCLALVKENSTQHTLLSLDLPELNVSKRISLAPGSGCAQFTTSPEWIALTAPPSLVGYHRPSKSLHHVKDIKGVLLSENNWLDTNIVHYAVWQHDKMQPQLASTDLLTLQTVYMPCPMPCCGNDITFAPLADAYLFRSLASELGCTVLAAGIQLLEFDGSAQRWQAFAHTSEPYALVAMAEGLIYAISVEEHGDFRYDIAEDDGGRFIHFKGLDTDDRRRFPNLYYSVFDAKSKRLLMKKHFRDLETFPGYQKAFFSAFKYVNGNMSVLAGDQLLAFSCLPEVYAEREPILPQSE